MKDFEIDLRFFLFSFWKIRYHILIFPFICILLVLAHGLFGKILKKNILLKLCPTMTEIRFLQPLSSHQ